MNNDTKKHKRYTVTSALPYANGPLHIGHIAGAYLPADTYVRYLRLKGEDVLYVCGSDEYGAAILLRAKKEGINPREIIDKYHGINKKTFEDFGISFDIYHRTSDPIHTETAQGFFTKLHEKGEFEVVESEQYFDETHQQFLADRYILGQCPKCGHSDAYGDQCEKCGSALSPKELINPKSTLSGETPIMKSTKHWYLGLDRYNDWLKKWIVEEKKGDWKPTVYGQCKSWIDQGLQPRAMTRDLTWGVPVPLEDAENKVLYVWLDAPIGYISATKAWAKENDKNWEDYWKDDETKLVHFIGKDNIVFHCIIFPIILKAHGEYILPENVPANEFLNLEGDKLSTSRNWAVWLHEFLEDMPDKKDVLRYVLTSIAPENKDSEFTWKDFQSRNNNELVADLGNFVNRTLILTTKYYKGEIPARAELSEYDEEVLAQLATYPEKIGALIEEYRFKEALFELMNVARLGNKYLAETEPWKKAKTDPERVKTVMNIALQITANLQILMKPFLPETSDKLGAMLNKSWSWNEAGEPNLLVAMHKIEKPSLLFSKIEDEEIEKQVEKLKSSKKAKEAEKKAVEKTVSPEKEAINFEDFTKLDIRIATILEAEKVPKTSKLLKLKLEVGTEQRTVVSGIAQSYKPEEIIGKQVTLLANLKPRKIKGIESQGMILMAENSDGKLAFVTPDKAVENGGAVC